MQNTLPLIWTMILLLDPLRDECTIKLDLIVPHRPITMGKFGVGRDEGDPVGISSPRPCFGGAIGDTHDHPSRDLSV